MDPADWNPIYTAKVGTELTIRGAKFTIISRRKGITRVRRESTGEIELFF